jgi:hypothetical protein
MRHLDKTKVLKRALKYILIDKINNKASIFRFKTQIAKEINVSNRTLDRNLPYECKNYIVYSVSNVVF